MMKLSNGGIALMEGTRISLSWENFEKIFSNKWIKDKKKNGDA
jgi:hypothetical protein